MYFGNVNECVSQRKKHDEEMTATACTQIPTARSLAKPDFSQWEFVCRLLGVISLTTNITGGISLKGKSAWNFSFPT